jgi:hypothetical protein
VLYGFRRAAVADAGYLHCAPARRIVQGEGGWRTMFIVFAIVTVVLLAILARRGWRSLAA